MGLLQFVTQAIEFLDEGTPESVDRFLDLVLAGRVKYDDEDVQHRVLINAVQEAVHPTMNDVQITGDFDSLIGFTKTLPLKGPLSVYAVPDFDKTLKKSVHITLPVEIRGVSATEYATNTL